MAGSPRRRLRSLAVTMVAFASVFVAIALDARARAELGQRDREQAAAIARATGLPELALSTSSSWLRHPGLASPSAGAADAPIGLDVDPAGAVIPRPGHPPTITIRREVP